jgi:uncharacterized protein YgiM (DUF1202 family)
MTSTLEALTEIGAELGVDTSAPFKHEEVWKTVTATSLNIRNGPGILGSVIVGNLHEGARIRVLESRNGWARIGDNQWCSETYLK